MRALAFALVMAVGVFFLMLAAVSADFGEWSIAMVAVVVAVGLFVLSAAVLCGGRR